MPSPGTVAGLSGRLPGSVAGLVTDAGSAQVLAHHGRFVNDCRWPSEDEKMHPNYDPQAHPVLTANATRIARDEDGVLKPEKPLSLSPR